MRRRYFNCPSKGHIKIFCRDPKRCWYCGQLCDTSSSCPVRRMSLHVHKSFSSPSALDIVPKPTAQLCSHLAILSTHLTPPPHHPIDPLLSLLLTSVSAVLLPQQWIIADPLEVKVVTAVWLLLLSLLQTGMTAMSPTSRVTPGSDQEWWSSLLGPPTRFRKEEQC
jgi:hypothetical protein